MARTRTEVCMLCAPDPCECFAPAKKKPTPRKRPVAKVIDAGLTPHVGIETKPGLSSPPRQDLRARMKAAAALAPPLPRKAAVHTAARPVLTDDQVLLNAALRALGPIMHTEERDRYAMTISSSATQAERRIEWKARQQWQK